MTDAAPDVARTAADLRLALGRLVRQVRREASLLPIGQAAVLGHLDRTGPMTTSDLAAAERVRPQSMARTVALLVGLGLVEQAPHPTDGRKILVSASAAGRAALEDQRERRAGWLAEAIAEKLTPAEQKTLASSVALLGRLTER
ncbi:MAG TPA: MarR family transcriptional regulator [Baekduia sp.]|uniref:MarR family winged helix-turn-helix transcriptional regulator n=1 Tax=Baekduia sp. TaxID=2600305 RepID=UPI002C59E6BF|nr:MarR family transcriptional regulator [Baekduia sp.]HMJ32775.1 MarR family transcriptional regulator [Baekduia sp.]